MVGRGAHTIRREALAPASRNIRHESSPKQRETAHGRTSFTSPRPPPEHRCRRSSISSHPHLRAPVCSFVLGLQLLAPLSLAGSIHLSLSLTSSPAAPSLPRFAALLPKAPTLFPLSLHPREQRRRLLAAFLHPHTPRHKQSNHGYFQPSIAQPRPLRCHTCRDHLRRARCLCHKGQRRSD